MANNLAIAKKIFADVEISLSPGSGTCNFHTDLPWLKISEEERNKSDSGLQVGKLHVPRTLCGPRTSCSQKNLVGSQIYEGRM